MVDLRDTKPAFQAPEFNSRVVKRIRSSVRRKRNYRVVLDLHQAARAQELVLAPIAPYGHRLVIDLFPAGVSEVPRRVPVQAPDGKRDVVVAIDAGTAARILAPSGRWRL